MAAADIIRVPRVLLPTGEVDLRRGSVIACDQFTSQPEYWEMVEREVGDAPSTLRMVLPELQLSSPDVEARIAACKQAMTRYLDAGLLEPREEIVYVERQVSGGIRRGLVVELDLEAYEYAPGSTAPVRSTEDTVIDRLPPRMALRRRARLEAPHILVLYDDPHQTVLAEVLARRDELAIAYDVELMLGSGRVTGRLLSDTELQDSVLSALAALVEPVASSARYGLPADQLISFATGDGNHSLAAAKGIWDELRQASAPADHPARWALVELVNLHDESLSFEPIHRVVFGAAGLIDDMVADLGAVATSVAGETEIVAALEQGDVQRFGVVSAEGFVVVELPRPTHELAVGSLQDFLDRWLAENEDAGVDYVHGEESTVELARQGGNVGFLLPAIGKNDLFRSIAVNGPMPRKTFSMGHAVDKRFYLECRAIS